ncbi:hypothetical protein NEOLEDRAFT_1140809 [Neolentinus lepideus HHB14362 ss-1]|uniref:Uncharacterized protein n=1 Tax=Neolentinus lepideus HHB14362 ss-1 TaxID=1314782 RepID=A0A165P0H8_9AGAM|nr:hypothetical protein NEOLEDRAFT_1140809 [Neolentinus lepideus HHB14362 ss-1]
MSSPGALTSAPSPPPGLSGDIFFLTTPETAMRVRLKRSMPGYLQMGTESNTPSTTVSPSSTIASLPLSTTDPGTPRSFSEALANRSQYRPTGQYATENGSRMRIVIRTDPTSATCFDPADKELYDLWAPKR